MSASKLKDPSFYPFMIAVLAGLLTVVPWLPCSRLTSQAAAASSQSVGLALENSTALLSGEMDSKTVSLLAEEVGIPFSISCASIEFIGLHLEPKGKLNTGAKAKFTGCKVLDKEGKELQCEPRSNGAAAGTIETGKVKGELVSHELAGGGKELLTKLEPEAGSTGTFVTITFKVEGTTCPLPEFNPVHGTLFLKDGEKAAETHLIKHLVEPGPLTSLWVGGDTSEHLKTSIDGSIWTKLGGEQAGLTWGAKQEGAQLTWVVLDE